MPTLLTWSYKGRCGTLDEVQRLYLGEKGVDDLLGEVTIVGIGGGNLIIEDSTIGEDGMTTTRTRTAAHNKALQQRDAAARPPTGRPGQQLGAMAAFLGAGGSPVVHGKRPAPNAKGPTLKSVDPGMDDTMFFCCRANTCANTSSTVQTPAVSTPPNRVLTPHRIPAFAC